MSDVLSRWLFRLGVLVGFAHVFLCAFLEMYRESVYTLTELPWLIAAPILLYCGLLWGAALAVTITGRCTRSVSRWEAPLVEFVAYMVPEHPAWSIRIVALIVTFALGWMHLGLFAQGLQE
jgi:hypothetical protein